MLNVLTNNVYLGTLKFKEVIVENAHAPIIDQVKFDKVQENRKQRHEVYGNSAYDKK